MSFKYSNNNLKQLLYLWKNINNCFKTKLLCFKTKPIPNFCADGI